MLSDLEDTVNNLKKINIGDSSKFIADSSSLSILNEMCLQEQGNGVQNLRKQKRTR